MIEAVSTIRSLTPRLVWDSVDQEELSRQSEIWQILWLYIPMEELWGWEILNGLASQQSEIWHLLVFWTSYNRQDENCLNNEQAGDRGRIWLVDNSSPNSHQLTPILKSYFTPTDRTMGGRLGVAWILNNQQFYTYNLSDPLPMYRIITVSKISRLEIRGGFGWTIIGLPTFRNGHLFWSMISFQWTELWTEDRTRLWEIISASDIRTWQFSEGRGSSNRQNWNCGVLAIIRDLEIKSTIFHWHLPPRYLYFINVQMKFMKEKGVVDQPPELCGLLE